MAIQYFDRIHGFFLGTTAELLAKTEELTEHQGAVNRDTGDIVFGPGKYAKLQAAGAVGIRATFRVNGNVTIATALVPGQVHDGHTVVDGDIALLAGQTTGAEKGLYVCGETPERTSHTFNQIAGKLILVENGTLYGGLLYRCTNADGGTLDSTTFTFLNVPGSELVLSANTLGTVLNPLTTAKATHKILVIDETDSRGTIMVMTLANLKVYTSA